MRLSALAIFVFVIDVGTNIYTNIEASDDNFSKERDKKLAENRNAPEARRLLFLADSIAKLSLRNSSLMVENNSLAVGQVKRGERQGVKLWDDKFSKTIDKASVSDSTYRNYLANADKPVWDEYNRKVNRKKMTSFTGGTTGMAVGILTPIFSFFLSVMSVRPYESSFRKRCLFGAYGAQFLSSVITCIAIYMMFDSWHLAVIFGIVLFWCAPLVYESVARERFRLSKEFAENQKSEIEEMQKELDEKQAQAKIEQESIARRKERKAVAEKSRLDNLIQTANRLVNKQKADPLDVVPKNPDKAAEWFVLNGEPYGLQIKIAEHCGDTKSSFNRRVEQKRLMFPVNGKSNGNGKMVDANHT